VPYSVPNRRTKTRQTGREYVWFPVTDRTPQAKIAVFAVWTKSKIKLFVISTGELKNVSTFWLPADGVYATGNGNKPKRDWLPERLAPAQARATTESAPQAKNPC
jgi:hypothetical protein